MWSPFQKHINNTSNKALKSLLIFFHRIRFTDLEWLYSVGNMK